MKKTNIYFSLLGRPLFVGLPPIILTLIDKHIIKPIMNPANDFGILDGFAVMWLAMAFVWNIGSITEGNPVKRGSVVLSLVAIVVSSIICCNIFN